MKNKWILRFLLIALAYNFVSPLLATSKGNDFIEDSTLLLKINPLPAIQNGIAAIKNLISNSFTSVTESTSKNNFLGMLSRGVKEVGSAASWFGAGIASIASKIPGRYFQKPETLEGFSKSTAIFDAALLLSASLIAKQFSTLSYIDWKIGKSEKDTVKNENFLFGSWKYKTYKTYNDILTNAQTVKNELLREVCEPHSRIYILNNVGVRIEPEKVTKLDLQNALKNEQKKLRQYLKIISYLTDAPHKILELVREQADYDKSNENSYLWYQEEAFSSDCINYFKNLGVADFNEFSNNLIDQKCNSYIKSILFTPPGWDFCYITRWRLGIFCYTKASKLYWRVYTRYLRTCALLDIITSGTAKVDQQSKFQKLLDRVNALIDGQESAYDNEQLRAQQISRLQMAIDIAGNLKKDHEQEKNDNFVLAIIKIKEHFININSILLKTTKKPTTDTAKELLNCVKDKLSELIKSTEN